MYFKRLQRNLAVFIFILLCLPGAAGYFLKHVKTGKCIYATTVLESSGNWGEVLFLELSNNCLDDAAQFCNRANGAMLNLKRKGCLYAAYKYGKGKKHDMLYLYVSDNLDLSACASYRSITQTSWGGLSTYYKGYKDSLFQTWCAVPQSNSPFRKEGIDPYIRMTKYCNEDDDKRFNFGSVTCYGEMVRNATCPKASSSPGHVKQYMMVKTASYRGLSDSKTCGFSDDYNCTVDVTCLVRKQCDGQHECNIIVNETLFSDDMCPGLKKYLYFEYRCFNDVKPFSNFCVRGISLSNSSLPNEGIVQITANNWTRSVCAGSLTNKANDVVCVQMGYKRADSVVNTPVLPDSKDEMFSGTINCNDDDNDLSYCSFTVTASSCSQLSYIKCHICNKPLLGDKERFSDSSFNASVSSEHNRASDARISSGSSWCAPVSDGEHYLQVDFKKLYLIYDVATFGDGTSAKWVKTYILNYTTDLINWKQFQVAGFQKIIQGNKNRNDAAITSLNGIQARALQFIPLSYEGQPCMRIEICGERVAGFFVKHVKTGMCVNDTGVVKHSGQLWGSLSFLELSSNSCFDKAAQFRFRDNGAMFNIKRKGCLAAYSKNNFGFYQNIFYLYVPATSIELDVSACAYDPERDIYRPITQTSWGGLSIYYKGYNKGSFQTWCAVPKTNKHLDQHYGIDPYIGLTTDCDDIEDKRFIFGSVTCYGELVGNINCPKDQYMVVKTASYRGLSDSKTCGLSDDYNCTVDVTCLVKKHCDGQHECNIPVDETLFPDDLCPGLKNYLYFEYQCSNSSKDFEKKCAVFPDQPRNLTVTSIKSRNAKISWIGPENEGYYGVSLFRIRLKKDNSLILNTTTGKITEYLLSNLTPYTRYVLSVAAGNVKGIGDEKITSFLTSEEAPSGPPLNIKTTSRSTSSLSFIWDPPEESKQNGVIIGYTVCVLPSGKGGCFQTITTSERYWIVRKLNSSTKYYIRVRASTKAGHGNYSESKGFFTNGKPTKKAIEGTSSTLTFSLEIPGTFAYLYVVALKLKNGKEPESTDSFMNNNLVTYAEARRSADPKPYIAAVFTPSDIDEHMFILGDGKNTSDPTSRKRRSAASGYYNGPLEPGSRYSIFQRVILNEKNDFYSTDWSPASSTTDYTGSPHVLTNMSSGNVIGKEGDLVNLLCSAQGEPPITFSWEKDQTPLGGFIVKDMPHRSSLLVVTVKGEKSFGKYICHVHDRFQSTTYTVSVQKPTDCGSFGNHLVGIIVLIILVVFSLVMNALLFHRIRRLKSSSTMKSLEKASHNLSDIYENPKKDDVNNYEQVEDEQSTYTALKKSGKDKNDDHVYSHLNKGKKDCKNQDETGI
ncbi:uncharacterized protein LOC114521168 [Dendronephthya gigantea]|uniref:uncharacterized protein LOC114521168 n=1 Tax=Dendronephthya gigantea TaxID=151771 RepID=UPI00106B2DB7|nr:uncharacterized protein LOC114521168 [Dendronephthya gigantea]